MGAFENVVVGLDLHEAAAGLILSRARQVADSGDIEVVHVCDHLHHRHEDYPVGAFKSSEELDAAQIAEADRALDEMCRPFGIDRHQVLDGEPAAAIHAHAANHSDLVVVGSHGRHGWRLLFGSTPNAVLHGTPCDVLAVHVPEGPEGPEGEPTVPEQYQRILVAVDLSDESEQVMAHAQRLADTCAASLAVCHVVSFLATDKAAQSLQRARLIDLAVAHGVERDAVHMVQGRPAATIHALADELQADLIVVGTHGKHGAELVTGSTANAVLHGAHCDALSVRLMGSVQ